MFGYRFAKQRRKSKDIDVVIFVTQIRPSYSCLFLLGKKKRYLKRRSFVFFFFFAMHVTVPIFSVGPYTIALVTGLLLYWNASLVFSRCLTAFLATMLAMKLDLAFHLFYACFHHVVAVACRVRTVVGPQDVLDHFQTHSQLYVIADVASIALLVGNTLQFWSAALITRIALSALVTRAEIWMRWWETQSVVEHLLAALSFLMCIVCCALQWAYYVLLPREEIEAGGFASLLMWYTSTVYIVAVGVRAACSLVTAFMRLCGYRLLQCLVSKADPVAARALEDTGLNPHSEVHELYMAYVYAVVCAVTAWYYAPSSLPMWMQCFVLLRLYLIAIASGKLQRYKQVLDRFPSVSADPSKACAICCEDFLSGEHVTCLPCGHTFHGACVRTWLVRSATCPTCRQPVVDADAWRTRTPRQRVVVSGVVRGDVGGRFSGSVRPLAPRLPAARQRRRTASTPAAGVAVNTAAFDARQPPHSPLLPGFSIERAPLPHLAELQSIEAARRSLKAQRQSLISSVLNTPVSAAPPARVSAMPVTHADDTPATEDGVDSQLFTDTPLVPAEPAPEARRHKRQRAQASATEDEVSPDDDASPRRRRE